MVEHPLGTAGWGQTTRDRAQGGIRGPSSTGVVNSRGCYEGRRRAAGSGLVCVRVCLCM